MLLTRREAIGGCCAGGLALLTEPSALAEASYPHQTIKVIVSTRQGVPPTFSGLVADHERLT